MPRALLSLMLVLLLNASLSVLDARGQEATPATGPTEGTQPILRISETDLASNDLGLIGFVRAVYDSGAEQALSAAEGPAIVWIESGSVTVVPGEGSAPFAVSDAGDGIAENLSPLTAGEEAALAAGQALVLPAGGSARIRNSGDGPAITIELLPAADVVTQPAAGVNQRLIARHETPVLSSPFAVELGRATIQPGTQYPDPANALDFLLMSVDPAQLFALTRNNFNRGASPMEIYVLTITPVEDGVTTPTA